MSLDYQPWTPDQALVTVTISEPDAMSVDVFNVPYNVPAELLPLTRASFGAVMDHLWSRIQEPFTVEIIETDGTRQTGTIDLHQPDEPSTPRATGDEAIQNAEATAPPTVADTPQDEVTAPVPELCDVPMEEAAWQAAMAAAPVTSVDSAAGGFLPGEHVAVALVVGDTIADADGRVEVTVPTWMCQEMLLAGRSSGNIGSPTPGALGR